MPKTLSKKPTTSELRIIAGLWRGRKLSFPDIDGLRPTGDRLRETLFNWLMPEIQGARVLDLFAGSGALGIEALSRGAGFCLSLEKHSLVAASILENLKKLGVTQAKVVASDTIQYLQQGNQGEPFNLIFMDPPFALNLWDKTAEALTQSNWLANEAWVYVETPRDFLWQAPVNWHLYRDKQSGQVRYRLYKNF